MSKGGWIVEILKDKSAIFLTLSSSFTFIGNGMHFIALTWMLYELTSSPLAVTLLIVFTGLPFLISFPFTGVIADRINRKKFIIFIDIARAGIVLLLPILYITNNLNVIYIYMITIMLSLLNSFFYPSFAGVIKSTVKENLYLKVMAMNSSLLQVGMIIGTGLSGFIIYKTSVNTVFILDAITYAFSALLISFVPYKKSFKKENIEKLNLKIISRDFSDGMKYIFKRKLLKYFFFLGLITPTVVQIINSLLAVYISDDLNRDIKAYGAINSFYALGATLSGIALTLYTINKRKKYIELSYLLISIGFFLLAITNNTILVSVTLLIIGFSVSFESVLRRGTIFEIVEDDYVGRVESFNWSMSSILAPTFAIMSSFIVEIYGTRIFFLIFAILIFIAYIISINLLGKLKDTEEIIVEKGRAEYEI